MDIGSGLGEPVPGVGVPGDAGAVPFATATKADAAGSMLIKGESSMSDTAAALGGGGEYFPMIANSSLARRCSIRLAASARTASFAFAGTQSDDMAGASSFCLVAGGP